MGSIRTYLFAALLLFFGSGAQGEQSSKSRGLAAWCEFSSVGKYGGANSRGTSLYVQNGKVGSPVRVFMGARDGNAGLYVLVDNLDHHRPVETRFLPLSQQAVSELRAQRARFEKAAKELTTLLDEQYFLLDPAQRLSETRDIKDLDRRIAAEKDLEKGIKLREQRLALSGKVLKARKDVLEEMQKNQKTLNKLHAAKQAALDEFYKGINVEFKTGTVPGYTVKVTISPSLSSEGNYLVSQSGLGARKVVLADAPDPVDDQLSAQVIEDDIKDGVLSFCENAKKRNAESLKGNAELDARLVAYCKAEKKKGDDTDCNKLAHGRKWGLEESSQGLRGDLEVCLKFVSDAVRIAAEKTLDKCPGDGSATAAPTGTDAVSDTGRRVN